MPSLHASPITHRFHFDRALLAKRVAEKKEKVATIKAAHKK